jgi:arsenate reductase
MAEGLLRSVAEDRYESLSAGLRPVAVDALALEVMHEIGIDISSQQSKDVQDFLDLPFSAVVTICDEARESCPQFPSGCRYLHWRLQDPITIIGSRRERLAMFRLLRDEIALRIEQEFGTTSLADSPEVRTNFQSAAAYNPI